MERIVRISEVKGYRTKSGNIRFVARDEEGSEYTTFKEAIGARALQAEGRRARIEFHEQQRDGFTNVYLDAVEPLGEEGVEDGVVEEAAWKTAIEAAPLLVDRDEEAIPPEELFERVKPFKDLVAGDIRGGEEETAE